MSTKGIFTATIRYLRRRLVRITVSVVITSLFLAHVLHPRLFEWPLLAQLENIAYDMRVRLDAPGTIDPRIVIIDIDERSLALEGRWPWNRKRMAELIDLLFDHYRIGLLGMDVVWGEEDHSGGLATLRTLAENQLRDQPGFREELERLAPQLDYDQRFAASLRQRPVVLGYYFDTTAVPGGGSVSGALPAPDFDHSATPLFGDRITRAGGYGGNLPRLQTAALGAGHFNPAISSDGKVRKIPMLIRYGDNYYGSLSLAIAELLLGEAEALVHPYDDGENGPGTMIESLELGRHTVPLDGQGRALIPFRGERGSFPYLSASDVLHQRIDPARLQGAIALLGTSAPGLVDLRPTPMGAHMPGVELHANMLAGILDQTIKRHPQYTTAIEFLVLLAIALVMTLFTPINRPIGATAITLTLLAGVLALNLFFWRQAGQVIPIAASLSLLASLYLFNMSYGFFVEARGKRQITRLFCQYLPPERVRRMSLNPERFSRQGESRRMTVLFSDVRDFTGLSEHLPPLELHQLMNEYLTPMTRVIHEHRGTIDKYIGDAIMAFWGAPLDDPEHARNTLLAARDMHRALTDINRRFRERGWPQLRIGIGINSGEMIVGDMGSEFRQSYTVMGDAVNLGSRLEGLTKRYGVDTIISEATREQSPEIPCRELDRVRVKGKARPVTIYEPLFDTEEENPRIASLARHDDALRAYRDQDWDSAGQAFRQLHDETGDTTLYELYLQRIEELRHNPLKESWDGVYNLESK